MLTPFEGVAYDGVLDFAAVVQDPEKPARSRPDFDSRDHRNPSPAGYTATANGIDLSLFRLGGH